MTSDASPIRVRIQARRAAGIAGALALAATLTACGGAWVETERPDPRVQLAPSEKPLTFPRVADVPDGPPRRPTGAAARDRIRGELERRDLGADKGVRRPGGGAGAPGDVQLAQADTGGDRIEINRERIPQMSPSQGGEPVRLPGREGGAATDDGGTGQTANERGQRGGETRIAVIHFGHGAAGLSGRDRRVLEKVSTIHERRGGDLRIVGHASSRTRTMSPVDHRMTNFRMSMRRAQRVAQALDALGVPARILQVQARADRDPIYHEVMPSGAAGNRRAEIYLRASR